MKFGVNVGFEFPLLVSSAAILSNAAYDGFALSSGQEAASEEKWVLELINEKFFAKSL